GRAAVLTREKVGSRDSCSIRTRRQPTRSFTSRVKTHFPAFAFSNLVAIKPDSIGLFRNEPKQNPRPKSHEIFEAPSLEFCQQTTPEKPMTRSCKIRDLPRNTLTGPAEPATPYSPRSQRLASQLIPPPCQPSPLPG